MNKMIPLLLILALVAIAGAGIAMNKKRYIPSTPTGSSQQQSLGTTTTPPGAKEPAQLKNEQMLSLTISSPAAGSEVLTQNIIVRGQTAPNTEVFVNDASGKADRTGYFAVPITLDEGNNNIIVVVNDEDGNSMEKEIIVSYSSGQ